MNAPPILNIADLEFRPWGHGERYEARIGAIGAKLGAQKLGTCRGCKPGLEGDMNELGTLRLFETGARRRETERHQR